MPLLHTQTLFCSASEFAVCLIQDLWWRLPPAPPNASMPQFLLSPGKFEIMASLKVHSSFQLSSHALSGGSMSGEIFFFWKQWRFPAGCLWRCHQDLDSVLWSLLHRASVISLTNSHRTPAVWRSLTNLLLQTLTHRWRHLSTLGLPQIKTLACFLETFSQIFICHFQLKLAKPEFSILLWSSSSTHFFHCLGHLALACSSGPVQLWSFSGPYSLG